MNSEHPEYNRDTNPYPSFGKKYNSERAIISLTSWKARINTVGKTIYSLLKNCPGFHIVLVLSEEEFPKKEKELPEDLMLFVNNNLIEILWVYKNYKSFKKVLFTMDKYRDVPVISADDDILYDRNYCETLFNSWDKKSIICNRCHNKYDITITSSGCGVLFPPNCFKDYGIKFLNKFNMSSSNDDMLYALLSKKLNIKCICLNDSFALKVQINNNKICLHDSNMYSDKDDYPQYNFILQNLI